MSDQDACICGHVSYIHRPSCDGKYAPEGWQKNEDRDCSCEKFVLGKRYIEPETCPTCGQVTEDSRYE